MKTANVIIYSHRVDNDGYASAALMNMYFPLYLKDYEGYDEINVTNVGWTYGDDEPCFDDFADYDYVMVLDLHFDNKLTYLLHSKFGKNFIWIDHHAQCVIDYENYCIENNFETHVNGFQSKKTNLTHKICNSAAELCWYYLFGCTGNERFHLRSGIFSEYKPLPNIIEIISDFDVWNQNAKYDWNEIVYPFQMGSKGMFKNYQDVMTFMETSKTDIWHLMDIINIGMNIIHYETTECNKDIRSGAFYRDFEYDGRTYKACILNTTKRSSNVFVNMPDRDDYDVFVCYNVVERNGKFQYRYSMYAFKDDVNCAGMIINNIRFNGHAHACGAQSDEFIF